MKYTEKNEKIDQLFFISDVHFGIKNGSIEWVNIIKEYFENFFIPILKRQKEIGRNVGVVFAGDFFDNRQSLDINVMNVALDIMTKISSESNHVYMMVGNHDIYKRSGTEITSLRIFSDFKNVTIIYDTMELFIKNNKSFFLVSWIGDIKEESKIIRENKDKYDYVVMHTELSGMTYDNNRPILNGVNIDISDDTCKILSGHIHKRQESKKGMYFGSPYHMSRSDIGNEKGIYVFTVVGDDIKKDFIENNYSPKYLRVKFSDYGRNAENWKDVVNNNYVDIVFTEDDSNIVNINKFVDEIQKYSPRNIELIIERKPVDINNTQKVIDEDGNEIDISVNPDSTIEEIFEKKISVFKLKKKDVKKINKMNLEYIKKAIEEL